MFRIGIDGRLFNQTGVGTYVRNLLTYLPQAFTKENEIVVYVMEEDLELVSKSCPRLRIEPVAFKWHSLGEQIGFYQKLMSADLDLMHFTYFSYPVRYRKPFIATIHDLTPIFFKTGKASTRNPFSYMIKHSVFQYVLRQQFFNAATIITPTKTVKRELVKYYGGADSKRIIPIYEGVDKGLSTTQPSNLSKYYKEPYLLYVGNFYPHKNVPTLIRAMKDLRINLILAGPEDFFANAIKQLVINLDLQQQIQFHLNPSRADLIYLYKHARALIHPSLSEGFGLPLVEAMQFDLPIVASDIQVFKELLHEKYTTFSPTDQQSLVRAVESCLQKRSRPDYDSLKVRYSFSQMADKTVSCYKDVLQSI